MRKMLIVIRKLFSKSWFKIRRFVRAVLKFKRLSIKRKILLLGSLIITAGAIYLSISLLSVSAARLEFANLEKNMREAGPCHEKCLYLRQQALEKIAHSLKSDKKLQNDLKSYFLDSNVNQAFKQEILKIIIVAYSTSNPPDFVIDYLIDKNGDSDLKAEIINSFLVNTNELTLIQYYFALLDSNEEIKVKEAAVKALSNFPDKSNGFEANQIGILQDLILNSAASLNLKSDMLFLLSDYFLFFPEETLLSLVSIYNSSSEPVLKAITIDTLNNCGYSEFVDSQIPDLNWGEYFNN